MKWADGPPSVLLMSASELLRALPLATTADDYEAL
jgi:hypothetical protein